MDLLDLPVEDLGSLVSREVVICRGDQATRSRASTFNVVIGRDRSHDQFGFASLVPTGAHQASANHALAPGIWAGVLDDPGDGYARRWGIHPFRRGSSGSNRLTAADAAHRQPLSHAPHGAGLQGHFLSEAREPFRGQSSLVSSRP